MKDWYLRQSPRDRVIVLCVGALCLLGALYLMVWEPLQSGLASRSQNVKNLQSSLQFMHEGRDKIRQGSGGAREVRTSSKAPYLLIDEIIRKADINPPERVEPMGKGKAGARVTFAEVEFDKLVKVIAELELYGLQVSLINISEKSTGMVSARFTMERV